jgi:hypothetical protein
MQGHLRLMQGRLKPGPLPSLRFDLRNLLTVGSIASFKGCRGRVCQRHPFKVF